MLIFVLDSTEDKLIYNSVIKSRAPEEVDLCDNIDAAKVRVVKKPYDLILVSRAEGKGNIYDLVREIKFGHLVGKSEIVFVDDHPTVSDRVRGILRGRKIYNYQFKQLEQLSSLIGKMR